MSLPPLLGERRTGLMVRLVLNGLLQAGAAIGSALLVKLTFDRFIDPLQAATATGLAWIGMWFIVLALISVDWHVVHRARTDQRRTAHV